MHLVCLLLAVKERALDMATLTKRIDKYWQAKVRKKGFPTVSKTFPTKAAAQKWAREVECEMDKGSYVSLSVAETTTLNSILERYLGNMRISPWYETIAF